MNKIKLFLSLLLCVFALNIQAQRAVINFNENWHFRGGSVSGFTIDEPVNIPHTWNAEDTRDGINYYRGEGVYTKTFAADAAWQGKRVFIRFEGVNSVAKVFINDKLLGEHRGGYSAFIYELTDKLKYEGTNILKVVANNEETEDVLPLAGDFNIYGGMYRPVKILVTEQLCISPLDYASPGVYISQKKVSEKFADIQVDVKFLNYRDNLQEASVNIAIKDKDGVVVVQKASDIEVTGKEGVHSELFTINNPILWNSRQNPYMYQVSTQLISNGEVIDEVVEPMGLRYFSVDPNKGFFLNGKSFPLYGASRHQDREGIGNALHYKHHKEDMDFMLEMGMNSTRLAHYQQSETIYDLCDSAGLVVWAEIPWIGMPATLGGINGYVNSEAFHNNAKQQLYELIRQNYNHPSIMFWGIFNEIQNHKEDEAIRPQKLIEALNDIAKAEDKQRLTCAASMLKPEEDIHHFTDVISWNRYYGWYYDEPSGIGTFLDETHEKNPEWNIGISEYGAGGAISQHSQKLKMPNPMGKPHPEEWQSYYHEEHYKAFATRPFVWSVYIWNMFDFGSHFRREGEHHGVNDKGMISFDRKTKKDAFFFYKANWSDEPVLHITSKKHIFRDDKITPVKVYTNLNSVTLTVNGKTIGTKSPEHGIVTWEDIKLEKGNNGIIVEGDLNGKKYTDHTVFVIDTALGETVAKVYDFVMKSKLVIAILLIVAVLLWYLGWRRKSINKWIRLIFKVLFILAVLGILITFGLDMLFRAMFE